MYAAAEFYCWLTLLAASWGSPVAQAELQEADLPSRHLLATDITTKNAEEALRGLGIDDYGRILFMRRGGDCPLGSLSENGTEAIKGYCTALERMRRCRGRQNLDPENSRPLFEMDCLNRTCVDTVSISATSCIVNDRLGIPLEETVNRSCELTLPNTNDSSAPHVPFFVTEDGMESAFDCLFGWPTGSRTLVKYLCIEGFFRLELSTILGGEPFVSENASFRCIRDTRCGGLGGEKGLWVEGEFICYFPKASFISLKSAAVARGPQIGPFLVACMIALLFSVL